VALENAAMAVWLLAPARRDERVLRRLRLQWADENDHVQAITLMQAMTGRLAPLEGRLERVKGRLRTLARNRGWPEEQVLRVTERLSWGSIVETAGNEADQLDGRDAKWCWTVGSGIAHARSWATLAALERTQERATGNGVVHVGLQASDTFVIAVAQSTGLMIAEGWHLFDQRRQAHIG
jgi:anti-sigma-K factor RskA